MPPDGLIRYLNAAIAPDDGVTDAELVRRCATRTDDTAFELLLRRHAGMVWRACRAVTRDHHAAEDAFQAVFLVLSRKAGAIRGSVPGWLHRVAVNAALKRKANRDRQGVGGMEPVPLPDGRGSPDSFAESAELSAVLHDELGRLAEAYRLPLVLCYLEGYTHAEAAKSLGWPVGTVATRVARGRDRLRDRLTRRGVGLPAGGVAVVLSDPPASALPPFLVASSVRSIADGSVRPVVQSLAHGVASAMFRPHKLMVACTALVVVAAAGAALTVGAKPAPADPADPPPEPPTVPDTGGLRGALIVYHNDSGTAAPPVHVSDAAQLAALEGFFPGYRKRPHSNIAGGWRLGYEVYFNFPDGNTVRVIVSSPKNDPTHWSIGGGDFRVKGDFHTFAAKLATAGVTETHGDWSKPVKGLKARLVLDAGRKFNGTPIIAAYVELDNVSGNAAPDRTADGQARFRVVGRRREREGCP